jgi:hypothetical protein
MIDSLRFQSMQNHRLLLLPSKIYTKSFFHMKESNSKSQTLTTPIQDSNHERKEQVSILGDSTATGGLAAEVRGSRRRRRPGGKSRATGRAAGREEPRRGAPALSVTVTRGVAAEGWSPRRREVQRSREAAQVSRGSTLGSIGSRTFCPSSVPGRLDSIH